MMRSVPAIKLPSIIILLFLVICFLFAPYISLSQEKEDAIKKLSPLIQQQYRVADTHESVSFVIAVSSKSLFKELLGKTLSIIPIYEYPAANVFLVRSSWKDLREKIIPRQEVLFIDILRMPKEEVAVSNLDLSTNKVTTLHRNYAQYNGLALGVSVKENRPDSLDIDLKGRYVHTPLSSAALSAHATIMATIIAGAGNTYYEGRGVANGATISSVNFSNLLPEPDAFYQQYNITVQNHSYGTGIENYYGADALAYDASVITRPSLMHIFSAGNSGTLASSTGPYAGISSFANITGSFKMAKNIITIGHTDSFGLVLSASSRGPAYDGRVKPELVAFGEDGSSGAAAIVSGTALTIQQAYKDLTGNLPSSALVKAVLLNSADDAGPKGIDFIAGFGSVNALKAMQAITGARYINGSVSNAAVNTHPLVIPAGIKQVKITMVWNDPPAAANAPKALINDIDLELSLPASGQIWQPWVLSHFPHIDSLQKLPTRKRDSLNNVEQITIDNPVAGNYIINVKGFNVVASAPQSYFITYQFDTLNKFNWYYPTREDNIFSGVVNTIRWESTYPVSTGQLEYSINNGSSWQLINNAVDLSQGYFKWNVPDTFANAMLRLNLASQLFQTESFTISKRFNVWVGFNCPDSFLLYWNKQRGVNSYRVFRLGEKYMELLLTTTDTSIVLGKLTNPSLYYAIAPVLGTQTGVRSYGFNYTTQGVGCYIRTFFTTLVGTTGVLDLELGTDYLVKSITWEKFLGGRFVPLQITTTISGLFYSYTDISLLTGLNIYRVRIELLDGRVIYSQQETLYYFDSKQYIIYPNPANQYQPITILSREFQATSVQVLNAAGSKVYEKQFNDQLHTIPAGKLSKGFYIILLTGEGNKQESLKLLVQ